MAQHDRLAGAKLANDQRDVWARIAKTVSKSRSLVACSTWMCSPTVRAAASRSLDRVLARVGLLGLTSRAMTVEHYRYLAAETERKNVVRELSGARVS
jgi:hypothetical protein